MTVVSRGTAPVGVALLVAVAVVLAAGVGAAVIGSGSESTSGLPSTASPPTASFEASATADGRVEVVHRGGDVVDVRELEVRILVDGTPLEIQPPVPFFSAEGFYSGPTGPFNPAADPEWQAGESASIAIAGTNAPTVSDGSRIEIEVYAGETPVAKLETIASETEGGETEGSG